MPYVKKAHAVKIALPSDKHYFVMWRDRVSYGELREARQQAVKVDEDGNPKFDANAYSELALLAHIESWNLDDEDGKVLPLTAEALSLLDNDDVSSLNERMATTSAEKEKERKNS